MARSDYRTFKPKGESKQQFVDRVHETVKSGETIHDLWTVYYRNRFEIRTTRPFEPEMIALLREVFYAGVASMFQLINKASEGGDTEADIEAGAERMQRLYEELDTYTKNLR